MTQRIRYQLPDRNLGLDLMRVTEAAALAAGRWAGRGDKEGGGTHRPSPLDEWHADGSR